MRPPPLLPTLLAFAATAVGHDDEPLILPLALEYRSQGEDIQIDHPRPDRPPPAGVIDGRVLRDGEWVIRYRFQRTEGDDVRDGTGNSSVGDLYADGYTAVPEDLVEQRHLFSFLYGMSSEWTLFVHVPFVQRKLRQVTAADETIRQDANGLGDPELGALWSVWEDDGRRAHLNLGVSLPLGSDDETDDIDAAFNQPDDLPYGMQPGSGTYDLRPGFTLRGEGETWSWGTQLSHTFRFGEGSEDYTLGERTEAQGWLSRRFNERISGSMRLAGSHWENIDGRDEDLDATFSPINDTHFHAGQRLDVMIGVNYVEMFGHHFSFEVGGPVHQDLDGPQIDTDVIYALAWRVSF